MKSAAKEFTDLLVWQKAHAFVLEVYHYSGGSPKEEQYGLTSRFRRAAVSIPANIAEGFVKRGVADKARFFNIAQGSLEECIYYLILAKDLDFSSNSDLTNLANEVGRLLDAYTQTMLTSSSLILERTK